MSVAVPEGWLRALAWMPDNERLCVALGTYEPEWVSIRLNAVTSFQPCRGGTAITVEGGSGYCPIIIYEPDEFSRLVAEAT